jgi:NAD(P)-dependent dehydrogenase (short-subunit alcohol dehydrogenase family)
MNTVLITGCSSGYGLATALHFHALGWKVFAAMRRPEALPAGVIPASDRLQPVALDVTDPESIANAVQSCGAIDVLVNNAGIGLFGAFEATPMSTVREVFETNTLGTMAMCQAVLPQFRKRRAGSIINVTSSSVLAPMPLVAAYTASKTAVEGFTASLALELAEFGVRARLVQPGYAPTTRFAANGSERMQGLVPEPYASYAQQVFAMLTQVKTFTAEADVAEAVWRAATEMDGPLRRPAGADAVALARRHLS